MKLRTVECLLPDDVRKHLRAMVAEEGSQNKLAQRLGCDQGHLSAILSESRTGFGRVAGLLGLKTLTVYVPERRKRVRGGRS